MFDLAIFDLPCAAIKTFFAQWQSKGPIAVINPVPEDTVVIACWQEFVLSLITPTKNIPR